MNWRLGEEKAELKVERAEKVGIYLSTLMTNFILRPVLSLLAASVVCGILFGLDTYLGSDLLPWWAASILAVLLAGFFALNDDKPVKIPAAHVGIMTFLGLRGDVYLEEGDHYWFGSKIGFGISDSGLPNRKDFPNESEKGFVFIGDRVISIWPNLGESDKVKLHNVSGDGSSNDATLTVTFKTYWPLAWANSDDPILDIAERSRSGLRTIAAFLPGFDNVKMQSVFSGLMGGGTLITALTNKREDIFDRGSVIQDGSGRHIFEMVKFVPNQSKEERVHAVEEAKRRVAEKIMTDGDETMRKLVLDASGNPRVQVFSLNKEDDIHAENTDKHLVPVLTDCGCHLERATIGEIRISQEVQDQANKAAGEAFQRRGQRMNAEAMRENTKTMREQLAKAGGEAALAAALAADGKGSFIHVSGGDSLARAAVAGAKTLGDKK